MEKNEDIFKALEISQNIYEMLKERLRKGTSEREVYSWVDKMVQPYKKRHHGDFMGDFISGPRTAEIGGDPTDRRLEENDIFMLDLSLRYGTQWCDTCRTFFLGQPSDKMRDVYEKLLGCMKKGQETVKAGIEACKVKFAMEDYLKENGYGGLMPHHGGHAVGKECYMKPAFEEQCTMTVEDEEIVTLEPGIYFEGQWGIRIENNFIVKGDKLINIFDYPIDMEYFIIDRKGKENS